MRNFWQETIVESMGWTWLGAGAAAVLLIPSVRK